jgi:predicted transcriptional regulator
MADKTMTLNLSEKEMAVLDGLAAEKEMSKTAIMRQALRLYQLVTIRLNAGEQMIFSGDEQRRVEFIGL